MQSWDDLVGLVTYQGGIPTRRRSPIPVLTGLNVEQLRSCDERRYHSTKPPINLHYTWNSAKYAKKHWFYPIFNSRSCTQKLKWTMPIIVIAYAAGTRITAWHSLLSEVTSCCSRTDYSHTVHASLMLSCAPMCCSSLNRKMASNSLDQNPENYSVWTNVQKMVYSQQNFRHWLTKTRANRV